MKRLVIIGGALVGLVVVVVVVILLNLGSVIKSIVEKVGSDATQAKVTLDSADVSVTSGQGALRGLVVGSPAGFTAEQAIRLGEISVALDVASANRDPIVIKEVVVGAPHVTYEFGPSGSNLDALKRNVEAYGGGAGRGAPASGDAAAGRRVVIENLYIRDGQIEVSASFLRGEKVTTRLPTIHLKDIGKQGGAAPGASASEVATRVIAAISTAATGAVGQLNVEGIQNALKGRLEGSGEALKAGAAGAEKAGKGVVDQAGERARKLLGR